MVESSRKHGHFDGRYPVLPKAPTPTGIPELDGNGGHQLDRAAFLGRYFPHRRRHDRPALAAYEAYLQRLAVKDAA